jgi:DNA polymerase I-like protein with 3'-5' exonuclease and polymerase domains
MKIAMIKINEFMRGQKSKLIMQVHDEVVFDIYP